MALTTDAQSSILLFVVRQAEQKSFLRLVLDRLQPMDEREIDYEKRTG